MYNNKQSYNKPININITHVIRERLQLQSNREILHRKFNIKTPDLITVTKPSFLVNEFSKWDDFKKKSFLIILGGPTNINKTDYFIKNLIKKYNKPVILKNNKN